MADIWEAGLNQQCVCVCVGGVFELVHVCLLVN